MKLLILCLISLCLAAQQNEKIVKTIYGSVEGLVFDNYRSFLGIPYAAPPVGDLRWVYPRPPTPWSKTLSATAFSAGCPQECETPPHTCPPVISEDCLYLNVYTPRAVNLTAPQPVMVFLHGGHFDQGAAGVDLYDGQVLVKSSNVILVTLNYRLGVLGWLASHNFFSGNYGLLDQQLALEWVRDNIAQFGGDPSKVTLFGQSAGGCSIRAHLISPASAGLFHRAIIQSDPLALPMLSLEDARTWGKLFQKNTGCNDDLNCLKKLNTSFLVEIQKLTEKHIRLGRPIEVFLPVTPIVDGTLVPYHWVDALQAGAWNQMPLMIGSTSEDALLFVYKAVKSSLNSAEYSAILAVIFEFQAFKVGEIYRPSLFGDNRPIMSQLGTDYIFTCSTRKFVNLTSSQMKYPVYLYQWNHALSFDAWGPNFPFCVGRVCHGSELPLEFLPPVLFQFYNISAAEVKLSQQMQAYWTNFGRYGNPNGNGRSGLMNWPAWTASTPANIVFQTPQNVIRVGLDQATCNFWDQEGYHFGW